jgi:nicotinic acid mononucleotide adenylyltransferase
MTTAHAALAHAATARAELVLLVYSVRALPKEGGDLPSPLLAEPDRLSILDGYCGRHTRLALGLCSHGLLAEQVQAARDRFPSARLFLVIGSDEVVQLLDPKWYVDRDAALDAMFAEATVLFAVRSGEEGHVHEVLSRPENERWRDRLEPIDVPAEVAAISARRVRDMIARGEDPRPFIPPEAHEALAAVLPSRTTKRRGVSAEPPGNT